jgi:hypothetical protein
LVEVVVLVEVLVVEVVLVDVLVDVVGVVLVDEVVGVVVLGVDVTVDVVPLPLSEATTTSATMRPTTTATNRTRAVFIPGLMPGGAGGGAADPGGPGGRLGRPPPSSGMWRVGSSCTQWQRTCPRGR